MSLACVKPVGGRLKKLFGLGGEVGDKRVRSAKMALHTIHASSRLSARSEDCCSYFTRCTPSSFGKMRGQRVCPVMERALHTQGTGIGRPTANF